MTIFLGKNTIIVTVVNWLNLFYLFKNKIIFKYVKFEATPSSFVAVVGCGIRDGEKSGSGINIPDPTTLVLIYRNLRRAGTTTQPYLTKSPNQVLRIWPLYPHSAKA